MSIYAKRLCYGVWRLPFLRPLRNLLANFKPELRATNLNPLGLGARHASSCALADLLRLQFRQRREQREQNVSHQLVVR